MTPTPSNRRVCDLYNTSPHERPKDIREVKRTLEALSTVHSVAPQLLRRKTNG